MTEHSGNICYRTAEAVTGRLWRLDGSVRPQKNCAKILIWNGECELTDELLDGTVGMIISDCPTETLQKRARRAAKLCRLPSMEINVALPDNTVAILDTSCEKLFINPDLETISAYFGESVKRKKRRASLILDGRTPSLPYGFEGVSIGAELSTDADEQQAYEYLCEISDRYMGIPITVEADASADTEKFEERVRAVYRAGVWGRFSLLCSCISTPEQAKERILSMHKVFRELDDKRREFDGFMPKGLLIDTPIMLLEGAQIKTVDFFHVDVEKLQCLLSGSKSGSVGESHTVKYVCAFAHSSAPCAVTLRNAQVLSDSAISALLATGRVVEICSKQIYKDRFMRLL